MKHPTDITFPISTMALAVSQLSYASLARFLAELAAILRQDGIKDGASGRKQLAKKLAELSFALSGASLKAAKAWAICATREMKKCKRRG